MDEVRVDTRPLARGAQAPSLATGPPTRLDVVPPQRSPHTGGGASADDTRAQF